MIINFLHDSNYRRKFLGKSDLFFRALGRPKAGTVVWDLTGGLLVDTIFMLQRDLVVKTFEVHSKVLEEIDRAIKDYQQACESEKGKLSDQNLSKALNQLDLRRENAYQFLQSLPDNSGAEILYMDPMFEDQSRESSALPKKGSQWLRKSVPVLEEADFILAREALRVSSKRLVIKRPSRGHELLPRPTLQMNGRSVRFDIYLKSKSE